MSNDPVLHLLGLARKAGRLEVGEEPVGTACRARRAKLVLLAADAAPNTLRRCVHFGEAGNVLWLEVPFTKEQLGGSVGRTSCALLAVTDAGFAAALCGKLAARDPEKYASAAQQLQVKADRALQRQREQRQHEKNLRQGKRKPWAPPPKEAPRPPGGRKGTQSGQSPKKQASSARRSEKRPPAGPSRKPTSLQRAPSAARSRPGPGGRRLTGKTRHDP